MIKKIKTNISTYILHILFFTGLFFLYYGSPGYHAPRSFANAWNLGHVVLFILFVFVIFRDWKWLNKQKPLRQWLIVLSLAVILAVSTEISQSWVLRQYDVMDIFRDLAGTIIGLLLIKSSNNSKPVQATKYLIVFLLVLTTAFPLLLSFADEFTAYNQFPLLAGFETPLEINRWKADGSISISNKIYKSGKTSLKVEFTTQKYSPVTLNYSLGKWEGFDSLKFSYFNPDSTTIKIVCRIHDNKHHDHKNAYSDRFNRPFILENGWNNIAIPIKDILNAPKTRMMELNHIEQISFFSIQLPNPRILYLDDLVLLKTNSN